MKRGTNIEHMEYESRRAEWPKWKWVVHFHPAVGVIGKSLVRFERQDWENRRVLRIDL